MFLLLFFFFENIYIQEIKTDFRGLHKIYFRNICVYIYIYIYIYIYKNNSVNKILKNVMRVAYYFYKYLDFNDLSV